MAQFDESKVINALHPEKAEVGKLYWFADNLLTLKKRVEENSGIKSRILNIIICNKYSQAPFVLGDGVSWELLYPCEEPPKQRMTNRQLAEWLAKGNGEYSYTYMKGVFSKFSYNKDEENLYIDADTYIRPWDSTEWIEPTVDIYERDCKKEN